MDGGEFIRPCGGACFSEVEILALRGLARAERATNRAESTGLCCARWTRAVCRKRDKHYLEPALHALNRTHHLIARNLIFLLLKGREFSGEVARSRQGTIFLLWLCSF
jgi:hypothetical protein